MGLERRWSIPWRVVLLVSREQSGCQSIDSPFEFIKFSLGGRIQELERGIFVFALE